VDDEHEALDHRQALGEEGVEDYAEGRHGYDEERAVQPWGM
jgi:hypothetical protein